MKKVISIIIATMIMILSASSTLFAAEETLSTSEKSATALKALNLFQGTDKGFELERTPSRIEGIVTIIRLLGKEQEALSSTGTHPFQDVLPWADRYVAYAYEQNITKGISETEFGCNDLMSRKQFATLLMRALGYSEESGDFTYENAENDGKTLGIINDTLNSDKFLRGDMVIMSYLALNIKIKNAENTLEGKLMADGVFKESDWNGAQLIMGSASEKSDKPASSGGSSSKPSKPSTETKVNEKQLSNLVDTAKDYYSELSKVIVLVDSEELHDEFDLITSKVEEYTAVSIASLSNSDVAKLYEDVTALMDDMEILAIRVAVER